MHPRVLAPISLALFLASACARGERAAEAAGPIELHDVGFATPESVVYDSTADVYLVSNINGGPSDKDGNGFISRVTPTGEVATLKWIDGLAEGTTLNAPKGLGLQGDTLFVADIDAVRLFDRRTGAPLGAREVPGATFLNDVAIGPDGTVYVTDTGIRITAEGIQDTGTDAVYRFDGERPVAIASGPGLGRPNGIVADSVGLVVVTFGSGSIYRLNPTSGERIALPIPQQGGLDGIVELSDGSFLISSWNGARVYRLAPTGTFSSVTDSIPSPADIGWDARRSRLLIPVFNEDRVLIRPMGTMR
jgi:sugar lactone lactonase YvrE